MTPRTWLEEVGHELTARGVAPADVASVVVELEAHLAEAGSSPLDAFGPPAAYAAQVHAALAPDPPTPGPQRWATITPSPASPPPSAPHQRRAHRPGHWATADAAAGPVGPSACGAEAAGEVGYGRVRVEARGVTMSYGRRRVLHGVDLEARGGEVVLLIGPNGVGKSTLLRILAGLARPDGGRVSVTGSIGYAPQSGGLVEHLRPAEHFTLFGRARGLDRTQATRDGQRLAWQLGWDALAAPVVGELSGGTRQKLNLVLAGLGDPDVLLLDEPYQGFDLDSTRRFWELVWSWRDAGRAIIVVSHAHDALERVDAVVELGVTPAARGATA